MDPDPRATKLLGDLLALTLSENAAQSEAALAAIRRRAERDGVTGGALKEVLLSLALPPERRTQPEELRTLHDLIETHRREALAARDGLRRAEAALARAQLANAGLMAEAERRGRDRTRMGIGGLAAGAVLGAALVGAWLSLSGAGAGRREVTRAMARDIAEYVHDCYLSNSNSLVGRPVRLHVLVQIDPFGKVAAARVAPLQVARLPPDEALYGQMVVRTLNSGVCGSLPLPEVLQGRVARLDLFIPE